MRKLLKIAAGMAPGLFALMLFCSSPTDRSLKWHTALEIPISSQKFFADSLMGWFTLDSNTQFLGSGDTSKLIDTLAYATTQKDSITMDYKSENLTDKIFNTSLGPIPLTGLAPQTAVISLGPLTVTTTVVLPTVTDTLFVPNVRQLTFDNNSVPLQIILTNTTPLAIDSITFNFVFGSYKATIGHLAPGADTTIYYPVGGYGFNKVPNYDSAFGLIQLSGNIEGTGSPVTIAANQGLSCQMSFTGMTLGSAIIRDALITFNKTFTNRYKISDSVNLDFVDIYTGKFIYQINNGSSMYFNVSVLHEDLWDQSFSLLPSPPLQTVAGLGTFLSSKDSATRYTDSLDYFEGGGTGAGQNPYGFLVKGRQTSNITGRPMAGSRLFTTWDPTDSISITTVDYTLQNTQTPSGWDTISSMDAIVFTISPVALEFSKMNGTITKAFEKNSDTTRKAIPFMWSEASKDSLRGKFLLTSVKTAVAISIDLPDSAMIQKFIVTLTIADPGHPLTPPTVAVMTLDSVMRHKVYYETMDITTIVNNFPDSVTMFMHGEVPVNSTVKIVNSFPTSTNTGEMFLTGHVNDQMIAKLEWTVNHAVPLDMGAAKFKLDPSIKKFNKLEQPQVSFNTNLINNTNINGTLYGLLDPKKGRFETLDSMSTDSVQMLCTKPGLAQNAGYINLLDTGGVKLAQYYTTSNTRDTLPWKVQPNSVVLNDQQMNLLLNSDSCAIRWIIRFNQGPDDALRNNDYVNIESWIKIEGVNSMDSTTSLFKKR